MQPFEPAKAGTVNIVVSAASQRVALTPSDLSCVRVKNSGTADAFIEFGDVTVTAALATAMPVGAGVTEVLTASVPGAGLGGGLYAAVIAVGATGTIYFTPGDGE